MHFMCHGAQFFKHPGAGRRKVVDNERLLIVTGSYGSGKTEYAVNLAVSENNAGRPCSIVDLDVVNPYFRTRDVQDLFFGLGIEVVAPEPSLRHADLPTLSPRVKSSVKREDRTVILDVGGDPMGARVLGRYSEDIKKRDYDMTLVVNTRRPETETLEDILAMAASIERASGLKITRLVANSHLMEYTDSSIVAEGVDAAAKAAKELGAAFSQACVMEDLLPEIDQSLIDAEIVVLKKFMKKPWEPGGAAAFKEKRED